MLSKAKCVQLHRNRVAVAKMIIDAHKLIHRWVTTLKPLMNNTDALITMQCSFGKWRPVIYLDVTLHVQVMVVSGPRRLTGGGVQCCPDKGPADAQPSICSQVTTFPILD